MLACNPCHASHSLLTSRFVTLQPDDVVCCCGIASPSTASAAAAGDTAPTAAGHYMLSALAMQVVDLTTEPSVGVSTNADWGKGGTHAAAADAVAVEPHAQQQLQHQAVATADGIAQVGFYSAACL